MLFLLRMGNLVCPSHFDLGETSKIAMVSTSEGDDKPIKYPMLFRDAKVVILNKMDLLKYTNFNYENFVRDFREVNLNVPFIETSCSKNTGLERWYEWFGKEVKK